MSIALFITAFSLLNCKQWLFGLLYFGGLGVFMFVARSLTFYYIALDKDTLYIRNYFYSSKNAAFQLAEIEHIDFECARGKSAVIWIQVLTPTTWSKRYSLGAMNNKQFRRLIKTLKKQELPVNADKIAEYIK